MKKKIKAPDHKIDYHQLPSRWALKRPMYLKKSDSRFKKAVKQLKKTGISYTEMWNLDYVFTSFILPRLKMFRKQSPGFPACFDTQVEWHAILDQMIEAFQIMADNETLLKPIDEKKVKKGLNLFIKYYHGLWY